MNQIKSWQYPLRIASILVVSLLCGCFSNLAREANVLQIGNGAEVQELDPHIVSGVTEHRVLSALFEGLTDCDSTTLEPLPAAAKAWEVSPDGLFYRFILRESAQWSNGDPVTARDFVYAWKRILSPALASEYAYMLYCLENGRDFNEGRISDFSAVGVKAEDDLTLAVTLERPTPYFLAMQNHFAWYPVHRATIEKHGRMDERGTQWTRPGEMVSNGPFLLHSWLPNELLSVRKNPRYWDAASVQLSGIDYHPIDNLQTEDRAFRSGLIQLTSTIPLQRVEGYRKKNPAVLNLLPYYGSYFYRINVTRPPFDQQAVRKAFALSLDREELVTNVLKGGETAAFSYVPPGAGDYSCSYPLSFDVEEARRLLASAGYPQGKGFPTVDILYNTSESHRIVAETIQRMWRENLGVEVRLLNQDWKVYLSALNTLDYDLARSAWIGDVADPVNFLECFQSDVGNNRTGWSSEDYDRLLEEAYTSSDEVKRLALLEEAEKLLLEECPVIPIYFYTWKFLKAPELQGIAPNILGYIRWKDLFLAEEKG
ncbi:MAG: peptide ABC transporter substrate-binding protein [Candidatus Hydrogenedens sp.]|nr:peptide ABC transporter substrate-binding protein [Candidatus Hydrogenedens sp.]